MVADDLVLASRCDHGMQILLNEAEADAQREWYIFSESKAKCQIMNAKYHQKSAIKPHLNGKSIESYEEETHLGIYHHTTSHKSSTNKKSGRKAQIGIAGVGFYALPGVGSDACLKLLQAYVTPGMHCASVAKNCQ